MTYNFTIKDKKEGYILFMKQTTHQGLVEREGIRTFDNPDALIDILIYIRDMLRDGVT